jgi:glycosyltransferase involved in cell wall biosynthesis
MKILIATDAWLPQVNGVVRTLRSTIAELELAGHTVRVVAPPDFRTLPCPTYPEIRLAVTRPGRIGALIRAFDPDAIHVATEGPIGVCARLYCARQRVPFTTSYTTKFPEYLHARFRLPVSLTYAALRWFHGASSALMVATDSVKRELESHGFRNVTRWTRGVDVNLFQPRDKNFLDGPRPILMYVGRVAVEKNIRAFLELESPGTKYVVGDGPQLEQLKREYPQVRFAGMQHGENLARYYAAADVLVMPSLTETFGLVILEALASGVPVAAYPAAGPVDVIGDSGAGALDANLGAAVQRALRIPSTVCRQHAMAYSWSETARLFVSNLRPVRA